MYTLMLPIGGPQNHPPLIRTRLKEMPIILRLKLPMDNSFKQMAAMQYPFALIIAQHLPYLPLDLL